MGRPVKKTASVAAAADGSMRLAVVADTHLAAAPALAARSRVRPGAILHAGDIGDWRCSTISPSCAGYAVRGNIDTHARTA
jgi:predicted phosphodiesterase